jgi:hypothetical protein
VHSEYVKGEQAMFDGTFNAISGQSADARRHLTHMLRREPLPYRLRLELRCPFGYSEAPPDDLDLIEMHVEEIISTVLVRHFRTVSVDTATVTQIAHPDGEAYQVLFVADCYEPLPSLPTTAPSRAGLVIETGVTPALRELFGSFTVEGVTLTRQPGAIEKEPAPDAEGDAGGPPVEWEWDDRG